MLPVWELLIIIIFSLIGLYLLAITVVYFFMKRAQKRAFSSLDSMIVYEKDRMNFINNLVNRSSTTSATLKVGSSNMSSLENDTDTLNIAISKNWSVAS